MNRSRMIAVLLAVGCSNAPEGPARQPGAPSPVASEAATGILARPQPLLGLMSIAVSADSARMATCGTTGLHAIARYVDGTILDVSGTASWTTTPPGIAVAAGGVSGASLAGLRDGTVDVVASFGGHSGKITVTLDSAMPASIALDPPEASVAAGQDVAYTATAIACDGTTHDVTFSASYQTTNVDLATTYADPSLVGIIHTLRRGDVSVRARWQGVEGSAKVLVAPPIINWIEITPADQQVTVGMHVQLGAIAHLSDNSTSPLSQVEWSSSDHTVVRVSPSGQLQAVGAGYATVSLAYNGIFSATGINVSQ